jgi:hypothetical protein
MTCVLRGVDGPLISITWSRVVSVLASSESLLQALTRLSIHIQKKVIGNSKESTQADMFYASLFNLVFIILKRQTPLAL